MVSRLLSLSRHLSPPFNQRIRTMATMKAVQVTKPGGVEVLEYNEVPVPLPSKGQVLVRNDYSGVNFIDT
jgi:NADPH-dependent curcumin reductase CurA